MHSLVRLAACGLLSVLVLYPALSMRTLASSHREAPLIAADPLADNTDVYAFGSPARAGYLTLIANFIPLQAPYSRPNFLKFDDTALYEIHIDNNGDAVEDITYQFRFTTSQRHPNTFLYNTGPVTSLDDADLNFFQRNVRLALVFGHSTRRLRRGWSFSS